MSTKPMLFSTDMVRALLDGRKTVTRQVVRPQPPKDFPYSHLEGNGLWYWTTRDGDDDMMGWWPSYERGVKPLYQPGGILYVRETWTKLFYADPNGYTHYDQEMYYYAADGEPDIRLVDGDGFELDDQRIKWRPSIHMPKEAARIFLRVTGVRVERLRDMTFEDCLNEGLVYLSADGWFERKVVEPATKEKFGEIWDRTIKPTDLPKYGWAANPWVWVIEFKRISKEEAKSA